MYPTPWLVGCSFDLIGLALQTVTASIFLHSDRQVVPERLDKTRDPDRRFGDGNSADGYPQNAGTDRRPYRVHGAPPSGHHPLRIARTHLRHDIIAALFYTRDALQKAMQEIDPTFGPRIKSRGQCRVIDRKPLTGL